MSKKKGLNFWEFAAVLMPEHRDRAWTVAHRRDAWTLLDLHQKSPNGCGRWAWERRGKQQMYIEVDADGLWRLLEEPAGIDVASFYGPSLRGGHAQSGK